MATAPRPVRYPPIDPKHPHFIHGGDYNPEQWLRTPGVIDEDFKLAPLAHINSFTVGVFSWVALEPAEGKFEFGWLDRILDRMAAQNMAAVLATPTGARPAWMSFKYPEVLRVRSDGRRNYHEGRHNHCLTSPVYREKARVIDGKLAERYHNHPALSVWHVSNEFSGECHCGLCYAAFRQWLRNKYKTLDALNHAWWTAFWSHTFTDWDQIEPQDPNVNGLMLDWKRFVTDQTVDFLKNELAAIRQFSKKTPATVNMMGTFPGLNYWKFVPELDVISWDAYPSYHDRNDTIQVAAQTAMTHDLNRSLKGGRPFMLMECSPSSQNWQAVNRLKAPGAQKLLTMQAVAHGSDTVQYFQFRKNRGSLEKFHGAVVDHVGHSKTRVFKDVADVGETLTHLDAVVGTTVPAEVAVILDWENRWALEDASGPVKDKEYQQTIEEHYRALWSRSIPMDVINADVPLGPYKVVIAPLLYMIRPGVAERIEAFVKNGGTFVATYLTGIADENDLVFLGGWPGPLRKVLGVWAEEIEALYDDENVAVEPAKDNALGLAGNYSGRLLCDLIHAEGAQVLATYGSRFFAGMPAATVNAYGKGKAYYLATRVDGAFLEDFYKGVTRDAGIKPVVDFVIPAGVMAQVRTDGARRFAFLMNFNREERTVDVGAGVTDVVGGAKVEGKVVLKGYGVRVLEVV